MSDRIIALFSSVPGFEGGVHPPQFKSCTRDKAIRQFPFAPVLNLPLAQHIGQASVPVVQEGQEVLRGQLLAKPDGFVSVALHAPASGTIEKIDLMPGISGRMEQGIYLKPFPGSTQEISDGVACNLQKASPEAIINAMQMAGIVGLGGAAFPTHVKLKNSPEKAIDTLIINGAECEPFLTNDHRVMLEQADDIFTGIAYLLKATGASKAIVGIESNKQDAVSHLQDKLKQQPAALRQQIQIQMVVTKYPQGAEKMLIKSLLDKEVPAGGLPSDVGVVSVNVTTAAETGRLLPHGRGIEERVITISGPAIQKPGNYRIPIGTPLRFALEQADVTDDVSQVYLGGPMMGRALSSLDISITKGTSGFLAVTEKQEPKKDRALPCIHCAWCVEACPMGLNPSQLGILARNREYDAMVEKYHLMDCFECGSCAFVCPSRIPLVQSFRSAKGIIRRERASKGTAQL